jgi:predicted nucleic acid-binding protein
MTPVFLDTSFLLALIAADDAHHAVALAWQKKLKRHFSPRNTSFWNCLTHW